jgi:hypothetical protein
MFPRSGRGELVVSVAVARGLLFTSALYLNLLGAREVCALTRLIGTLSIVLALVASSMVSAGQEGGGIILTSGTVKHVEVDKGIVVLDSGRAIAVRMIQRDGQRVELRQIKIDDDVFVSGHDLGLSAEVASQRAR